MLGWTAIWYVGYFIAYPRTEDYVGPWIWNINLREPHAMYLSRCLAQYMQLYLWAFLLSGRDFVATVGHVLCSIVQCLCLPIVAFDTGSGDDEEHPLRRQRARHSPRPPAAPPGTQGNPEDIARINGGTGQGGTGWVWADWCRSAGRWTFSPMVRQCGLGRCKVATRGGSSNT